MSNEIETDVLEPKKLEEGVETITIEEEMSRSYLDYAMSVIVSRALPDVRDGLKPVHRRILYAMKEGGYDWNRSYHKSAKAVGEVMGNYHPHGDSAIYDALVRMTQDFSLRLPLVDGQGNFGSLDFDPPAAMRYTEARLARAGSSFLDDIGKDTVDFVPNYDEKGKEPTVLPACFPNLLVNGAGGIAVGMATNIPPHNLGEVIDGTLALMDNPYLTSEELIAFIPGPDFPTGAMILGQVGIQSAYTTGRGSVVMRAKTRIEEIRKDREAIIVSEIPYQVNKARLMERIAEVVRHKTVEGISDLRDESDRDGVRVVIEIKMDSQADIVLNQLFRYTQLQTSFGVNMLAINSGRPEMMELRQILQAFIDFREEVVTRRAAYELAEARRRAHVLVGLAIAVANIDEIIHMIRSAPNPQVARQQLLAKVWPAESVIDMIRLIDDPEHPIQENQTYRLSEAQAKAILDLRLHRLTGLERDKIGGELKELGDIIADILDLLGSRERVLSVIREELVQTKDLYGTPRRTELSDQEAGYDIEDLIPREEMVITVSHSGYIKRVPLSTYRAQKRGGKGRSGMTTKDEDFVTQVLVANTHDPLLFFSSRGIVYKLKTYRLPQGSPQSKGKALINLLPLTEGETITNLLPISVDEEQIQDLNIVFATSHGSVRRNRLSDFTNVMANGKIAMKLGEEERLIGVQIADESQDVLLASEKGKAIRFSVSDLRVFAGRNSTGVRGLSLGKEDEVISLTILNSVDLSTEERDDYLRVAAAKRRGDDTFETSLSDERIEEFESQEQFLLAIANDGFGKRTSAYEYRRIGRGGKGVENINLERSGKDATVIAAFPIEENEQIMLVTGSGKLIRCPISGVRIAGRTTRGVTLFKVEGKETIVSTSIIGEQDDEEEEGQDLALEENASLDNEVQETTEDSGEETEVTSSSDEA